MEPYIIWGFLLKSKLGTILQNVFYKIVFECQVTQEYGRK